MSSERKVKAWLNGGMKQAELEVDAFGKAIRVAIDYKRIGLSFSMTIEGARRLASILLDAARDAAGELPGEEEGP